MNCMGQIDWGDPVKLEACKVTSNGLRLCGEALRAIGNPSSVDIGRLRGADDVLCLRAGSMRVLYGQGACRDVSCRTFVGKGTPFRTGRELDWREDGGVLFLRLRKKVEA